MRWLLGFALVSLFQFPVAQAQEPKTPETTEMAPATNCPPCEKPSTPRNVLGGHRYLPSYYIPQPFITSQLTFGFGITYGRYPATILNQEREIKAAGLVPSLLYQAAINDWLAVNLGVSASGLVGLDAASVLEFGASTSFSSRLGAVAKLLQKEKTMLSVGLTYIRLETISTSPSVALRRSVRESVTGEDSPLNDQTVRSVYQPDLRFAYTFNSVVAFQASLSAATGAKSVNDVSSDQTRYTFGSALDFDLKPSINFPIGAKIMYGYSDAMAGEGSKADLVGLGLYETYSERFNFGLEAARLHTDDFTAGRYTFVTRYVY